MVVSKLHVLCMASEATLYASSTAGTYCMCELNTPETRLINTYIRDVNTTITVLICTSSLTSAPNHIGPGGRDWEATTSR